jgi:hypothetical protein
MDLNESFKQLNASERILPHASRNVSTSDTTLLVVHSQRHSILCSRMLHESFGTSLQLLFMPIHEEQDGELTRQQSTRTHVKVKNTTAQFGLRVLAWSHKTPKL